MGYMRHQRWLPASHRFRRQRDQFDNTVEKDTAPILLTGEEVLERVQHLNEPFGKMCPKSTNKGAGNTSRPCWKKKSSFFFNLSTGNIFPVRHILDVMHIKKNVCKALLCTLLNIPNKTKDSPAAHKDLVARTGLAPLADANSKKRQKLKMASWNLSLDEKKVVYGSFFNMKVPTQFSSNIGNLVCMEDLRLHGLKSHDCHTILRILLPVALRSILEKPVRYAIISFCLFFKNICAKEVDVSKLADMQRELVVIVCLLEKYFPPLFFDVMIHLVREVKLCGPVFLRWMYPFERYMKIFKGYVVNCHRPEGSIAKKYVVEEAVKFTAEHMLAAGTTVGVPSSKIRKRGKLNGCYSLSTDKPISFHYVEMKQAHLCVLQNMDEVLPYFEEHIEFLKCMFPRFEKRGKWLKDKQKETFADWFKTRCMMTPSSSKENARKIMSRLRAGHLRITNSSLCKEKRSSPHK